jgi:hypothetical protein
MPLRLKRPCGRRWLACRPKKVGKNVRLSKLGCPRMRVSRSWFRHTSHFCTVAEILCGSSKAKRQLSPLTEKFELFRLTRKERGGEPYIGEVVAGSWRRPVCYVGLPRSRESTVRLAFRGKCRARGATRLRDGKQR